MSRPSREYVDIIIEDEDLAGWMPINNTFTRKPGSPWSESKYLWTGVLIQLGKYNEAPGNAPMDLLKSVKFQSGGTTVKELTKKDFEVKNHTIWINVVARKSTDNRKPPMGAADLEALLVTQPRPIRHYFKPYRGGITFWQNREHGWTLKAMEDANGGLHNSFLFRFQREDAFSVEIHDVDGCSGNPANPVVLKDIDTIRISAASGPDHGSQENPPQEP